MMLASHWSIFSFFHQSSVYSFACKRMDESESGFSFALGSQPLLGYNIVKSRVRQGWKAFKAKRRWKSEKWKWKSESCIFVKFLLLECSLPFKGYLGYICKIPCPWKKYSLPSKIYWFVKVGYYIMWNSLFFTGSLLSKYWILYIVWVLNTAVLTTHFGLN